MNLLAYKIILKISKIKKTNNSCIGGSPKELFILKRMIYFFQKKSRPLGLLKK